MSQAALAIQRAAIAMLAGLLSPAAFLTFALAVLAAARQRITVEAEAHVLDELRLKGLPAEPVGLQPQDWTAHDTQALQTVLERMNVELDALRHPVVTEPVTEPPSDPVHIPVDEPLPTVELPEPVEPEAEQQPDPEPFIEGEPDRLTRLIDNSLVETQQEATQQAMESYEITSYRFEPDANACEICMADAGRIYPTEHEASHHPGCRCGLVPIIELQETEVAA